VQRQQREAEHDIGNSIHKVFTQRRDWFFAYRFWFVPARRGIGPGAGTAGRLQRHWRAARQFKGQVGD
jgi:hypothetical protein